MNYFLYKKKRLVRTKDLLTVLFSHRDDWRSCGDPKISIRKENNRFLFKHQQIKRKISKEISPAFYHTFLLSENEQ